MLSIIHAPTVPLLAEIVRFCDGLLRLGVNRQLKLPVGNVGILNQIAYAHHPLIRRGLGSDANIYESHEEGMVGIDAQEAFH